MDPILLHDVRAAAADVAADTAGAAVAAFVVDIAGAAADARTALAGAAADAAVVVAADARTALAGAVADTAVAAADVAAAADSAADLYRRACHVRRHCGFHVPRSARSGRRFWF